MDITAEQIAAFSKRGAETGLESLASSGVGLAPDVRTSDRMGAGGSTAAEGMYAEGQGVHADPTLAYDD
jgi:hypothetical protein